MPEHVEDSYVRDPRYPGCRDERVVQDFEGMDDRDWVTDADGDTEDVLSS